MRPVRNKIFPRRPAQHVPIVRKVPANTVPYGTDISRNGRTVWAAYDAGGVVVAVAATADEARAKYWGRRRKNVEN